MDTINTVYNITPWANIEQQVQDPSHRSGSRTEATSFLKTGGKPIPHLDYEEIVGAIFCG